MSDPTPDHETIRHFADTDEDTVDDATIETAHWPIAEAWYAEAGCDLEGDTEAVVLNRLAAASIQTSADKEVGDVSLGSASKNYVALGMAGDGLMANANFMAAAGICPGLRELGDDPIERNTDRYTGATES